jgi:hypothetical protein
MLHHREQMAEMLAMMPAPPAENWALLGGRGELGPGEDTRQFGAILRFE